MNYLQDPIILALETATTSCSVALKIGPVYFEEHLTKANTHAQHILPMIQSLLNEAKINLSQIEVIAYGCGPGSFTGVRIAAAVVQGLAFGVNARVMPISTLQALASQAHYKFNADNALAVLDARMQQVYWGAFSADGTGIMRLQGDEKLTAPEHMTYPFKAPWVHIGYYHEAMTHCNEAHPPFMIDKDTEPFARDIASLAAALFTETTPLAPEQALPVYLRSAVVVPSRP